jgi:hypothetical protein
MLIPGLPLAAAIVALLAPGFSVLIALGVRERLWWVGMSAPVTMGLVLVTAVITGALGIRFSIYSFAAVTVLAAGLAFGGQWLNRRRTGPQPVETPDESAVDEGRAAPGTLTGKAFVVARLAGLVIGLGGIALGVLTWKRGLGSWSTPTQEHDPVTHSLLTAFIAFTGKAAPWQVMPVDVIGDTSIQFYPPGFSSMAALVTELVGDTMTALNLVTVAMVAVALPLGVAALTVAVLRHSGLGRGWHELAAGIAALVSAVLYRPGIAFAHDGGILPNASAMALVPGLVAAMLVIRKRHWAGALAIAVASAGVVAVHPSAAASVVLTLVAAWVGFLFTSAGRAQIRQSFLPLAVTGVFAMIFALPVILGILSLRSGLGDARADITPAPLKEAVGAVVKLPYAGYFDRSGVLGQLTLGVLALAGALAIVVFRRGWPILTAWLFWAAVTFTFHRSPNSGLGAAVGSYFYRVGTRIDSHMYLLIPVLVACLFVLPAAALYGVRLRRLSFAQFVRARPVIVLGGLVVALGALFMATFRGYYDQNVNALEQRYANPEFTRYNASDTAAVDWLHNHVQAGEAILNSANDGSTLAYVKYGLPIVNTIPDGGNAIADRVTLLRSFNTYPLDPQIQAILRKMNIDWVYVDENAPMIGTDPQHWNGGHAYTVAPGLERIAGLPGLSAVFHSGTVTVYHLSLAQLTPNN